MWPPIEPMSALMTDAEPAREFDRGQFRATRPTAAAGSAGRLFRGPQRISMRARFEPSQAPRRIEHDSRREGRDPEADGTGRAEAFSRPSALAGGTIDLGQLLERIRDAVRNTDLRRRCAACRR